MHFRVYYSNALEFDNTVLVTVICYDYIVNTATAKLNVVLIAIETTVIIVAMSIVMFQVLDDKANETSVTKVIFQVLNSIKSFR